MLCRGLKRVILDIFLIQILLHFSLICGSLAKNQAPDSFPEPIIIPGLTKFCESNSQDSFVPSKALRRCYWKKSKLGVQTGRDYLFLFKVLKISLLQPFPVGFMRS